MVLWHLTQPVSAATVIFSSFGAGDSFANDSGSVITGADCFIGTQSIGNAFTVSGGDYQLGRIEVATFMVSGDNSLKVSLTADNGGLPGTVIESFSLTDSMSHFSGTILSIPSITNPQLQNGGVYWVVLEAGAPNTEAIWCSSQPHVDGTSAWNNGVEWGSNAPYFQAFRVTAVPESSSYVLLGLGASGLVLRRRRSMNS